MGYFPLQDIIHKWISRQVLSVVLAVTPPQYRWSLLLLLEHVASLAMTADPFTMRSLTPTSPTLFSDIKAFAKTIIGYELNTAEGHRIMQWLQTTNAPFDLTTLTCYRHSLYPNDSDYRLSFLGMARILLGKPVKGEVVHALPSVILTEIDQNVCDAVHQRFIIALLVKVVCFILVLTVIPCIGRLVPTLLHHIRRFLVAIYAQVPFRRQQAVPVVEQTKQAPPVEERAIQASFVEDKATQASLANEKATQASPVEEQAVQVSFFEDKATQVSPVEQRAFQASQTEDKATQVSSVEEQATQGSRLEEKAILASRLEEKATQTSPIDEKGMQTLLAEEKAMQTSPVIEEKATQTSPIEEKGTQASASRVLPHSAIVHEGENHAAASRFQQNKFPPYAGRQADHTIMAASGELKAQNVAPYHGPRLQNAPPSSHVRPGPSWPQKSPSYNPTRSFQMCNPPPQNSQIYNPPPQNPQIYNPPPQNPQIYNPPPQNPRTYNPPPENLQTYNPPQNFQRHYPQNFPTHNPPPQEFPTYNPPPRNFPMYYPQTQNFPPYNPHLHNTGLHNTQQYDSRPKFLLPQNTRQYDGQCQLPQTNLPSTSVSLNHQPGTSVHSPGHPDTSSQADKMTTIDPSCSSFRDVAVTASNSDEPHFPLDANTPSPGAQVKVDDELYGSTTPACFDSTATTEEVEEPITTQPIQVVQIPVLEKESVQVSDGIVVTDTKTKLKPRSAALATKLSKELQDAERSNGTNSAKGNSGPTQGTSRQTEESLNPGEKDARKLSTAERGQNKHPPKAKGSAASGTGKGRGERKNIHPKGK